MLYACKAFKSLTAAFWIISQAFCVERVTNGSVVCVSMSAQVWKRIKTRYRRCRLSSAHIDWCFMGHIFICSMHQGSTGHRIWHLAVNSLLHFRTSGMVNRFPEADSCGSLKPGDWGSKTLEYNKSSTVTLQHGPCNMQTQHHLPQKRNCTCPSSFYKAAQTNTA